MDFFGMYTACTSIYMTVHACACYVCMMHVCTCMRLFGRQCFIIQSAMIETHTRTHTCMHARTHIAPARTHTYTHCSLHDYLPCTLNHVNTCECMSCNLSRALDSLIRQGLQIWQQYRLTIQTSDTCKCQIKCSLNVAAQVTGTALCIKPNKRQALAIMLSMWVEKDNDAWCKHYPDIMIIPMRLQAKVHLHLEVLKHMYIPHLSAQSDRLSMQITLQQATVRRIVYFTKILGIISE